MQLYLFYSSISKTGHLLCSFSHGFLTSLDNLWRLFQYDDCNYTINSFRHDPNGLLCVYVLTCVSVCLRIITDVIVITITFLLRCFTIYCISAVRNVLSTL